MGFSSFFEKIKNEKAKKETPEYLKQKLEVETLKSKIRKQQSRNPSGLKFGGVSPRISFAPNTSALFGMPTQREKPKVKKTVRYKLVRI